MAIPYSLALYLYLRWKLNKYILVGTVSINVWYSRRLFATTNFLNLGIPLPPPFGPILVGFRGKIVITDTCSIYRSHVIHKPEIKTLKHKKLDEAPVKEILFI